MKKSWVFLFVTPLFCLQNVTAAPAFEKLTCRKVISDEITVTVEDGELNVNWKTAADKDVVKLLRALADPKIPTSLLKAYGYISIDFSIPVEDCKFSSRPKGKFSCTYKGEERPLHVKAKVSPYEDDELDIYDGTISSASVATVFEGKKDDRSLTIPFTFGVASPTKAKITAVSDFFFANYWEYEGSSQPPSCRVDKDLLID